MTLARKGILAAICSIVLVSTAVAQEPPKADDLDDNKASQSSTVIWTQILSAVLAGGLAGQLVTLYWGNKAKKDLGLETWLRSERYKAFFDLLELFSATAPRDDYDEWPTKIRIASQRVNMLCEGGTAPKEITELMESAFQHAKLKKQKKIEDHDKWTEDCRETARKLRIELSGILHQ